VSEQLFPSGDWDRDDDRATTLVAELSEQLLDAISRPDHNWPTLNQQTLELHEIANAMAQLYTRGGGPRPADR
jgi:hypothetical protein